MSKKVKNDKKGKVKIKKENLSKASGGAAARRMEAHATQARA